MIKHRTHTPFDAKRQALISQLKQRGIIDQEVLRAMSEIPREKFVQPSLQSQAYEDSALPIDERQTISQPFTVAFMTQALHIQPGMKVLEIGTGSGYQAAVLAEMGADVVSIERHPKLSMQAREKLNAMGYQVTCRVGDGTIGYQGGAPYDAIIVTAGAPDVPEPLARQLKIGGRLAVPVGSAKRQNLFIVTRHAEEQWQATDLGSFAFVPLIGVEGWEEDVR
ncbi:MAG: protein-L-isoaspartate(D-aspartate) O-methyltransferase [Bradyrhizobiaceae bacterium]|nr:protein-L-isoaspartate(D-aspartate) O-methyltransferase [Bradyrhizobiaceae bacterium]